jgi:hypothetical protein
MAGDITLPLALWIMAVAAVDILVVAWLVWRMRVHQRYIEETAYRLTALVHDELDGVRDERDALWEGVKALDSRPIPYGTHVVNGQEVPHNVTILHRTSSQSREV